MKNERIDQAIKNKDTGDKLTKMIEKRAVDLRQFYTKANHKSTRALECNLPFDYDKSKPDPF